MAHQLLLFLHLASLHFSSYPVSTGRCWWTNDEHALPCHPPLTFCDHSLFLHGHLTSFGEDVRRQRHSGGYPSYPTGVSPWYLYAPLLGDCGLAGSRRICGRPGFRPFRKTFASRVCHGGWSHGDFANAASQFKNHRLRIERPDGLEVDNQFPPAPVTRAGIGERSGCPRPRPSPRP
jgi:hypothetical protein